jgi:pSer/pThr/pTyr-binding forkhead associated (FHA) protein/tetratricopeptide (TPR) repeat protein
MLRLLIEDDEGKTTVVPLIRDEITIGRKEGNTIRLTERNVSRRHARLVRTGEGADHTVIVEDLDSYNGIKLNGDKVAGKCTMRPGDLVQIGDYSLALQVDPPTGMTGDQPAVRGDAATIVATARSADDAPTALHRVDDTDLLPADRHGRLVVVSSNLGGQTYDLGRREIILGRTDENDVVINHRSISRNHAKIVVRDGQFTVIDLASSNGVRVNGEPFGTVTLVNGDIIELGHVKLRFVAPGEHYVFTPADIDDVEVPGSSGGTLRLVAIALLLAGIAIGTFFIVRPSKPKGPEAPKPGLQQSSAPVSDSGPVDVGKLLAEGDGHLGQEAWADAQRVFERVLQSTPNNEQARAGRERAVAEAGHQRLFDELRRQAAESQWADAYMGLEKFATGSVYSPRAQELLKKIEPEFAASELARGRGLLEDNDLEGARVVQRDLDTRGFDEAAKLAKEIKAAEARKPKTPDGAPTPPATATPPGPDVAAPRSAAAPESEPRAPRDDKKPKGPSYEELMDEGTKLVVRGNREEAAELFEKAIRLNPEGKLAHQRLCVLYKAKGDPSRALRHCKRWLDKETNASFKPAIQQHIDQLEAELGK